MLMKEGDVVKEKVGQTESQVTLAEWWGGNNFIQKGARQKSKSLLQAPASLALITGAFLYKVTCSPDASLKCIPVQGGMHSWHELQACFCTMARHAHLQ
eukprot:1157364-Pelagomonas_calceolata.AAC.5